MMLYRLEMENAVDVAEPFDFSADLALSVVSDLRESFAVLRAPADPQPRQTLPGRYFFNSMVSLPPPGTCLATSGRALSVVEFPVDRKLDAGSSFQVSGPGGAKLVTLDAINSETLGGLVPGVTLPGPYLRPGTYRVSTTGGSDVGGFSTQVAVPAAPRWTNRDEVGVIDRSAPLRIEWSVYDPGNQLVAVMVITRSSTYQAPAAVLCVEEGTAGTLDIPARHLMGLPASAAEAFLNSAIVMLASTPRGAVFAADGLDAGVGLGFGLAAKQVILE
jgi:hypothetical protein